MKFCECADSCCPVHETKPFCFNTAKVTLFRIDMEDLTGTRFCRPCSEDARDSGLFRGRRD